MNFPACRACHGKLGSPVVAHERQFSQTGEFHYAPCEACGALSLLDPPADLAAYFSKSYYSFGERLPLLTRHAWLRPLCRLPFLTTRLHRPRLRKLFHRLGFVPRRR